MMKSFIQQTLVRVILLFALLAATKSFAHMMVAQHGTLNFVENGAYMVLSLPVSGFRGIDDDGDGKMSLQELNTHKHKISKVVHERVTLTGEDGSSRPLQGLIISLAHSHSDKQAPVSQLIVMGRFLLADSYHGLSFNVDIYGESQNEQLLEITARSKQDKLRHVFALTPDSPQQGVF